MFTWVRLCLNLSTSPQEGRSPFIFQADILDKEGDGEDSDEAVSDYTIRQSLSRSSSQLEEAQQASYGELLDLASAMGEGESAEYVEESQPLAGMDGAHLLDDSQMPPEPELPPEDSLPLPDTLADDDDCEVVEAVEPGPNTGYTSIEIHTP